MAYTDRRAGYNRLGQNDQAIRDLDRAITEEEGEPREGLEEEPVE